MISTKAQVLKVLFHLKPTTTLTCSDLVSEDNLKRTEIYSSISGLYVKIYF